MFWPIVLPFQITCCVLVIAVVVLTLFAPPKNWNRFKKFVLYSIAGLIAFIPSCAGIMTAVDAVRFGDFTYPTYSQISDFRSKRYMPESATDIQMRKHANGYLARYTLSPHEFDSYLNGLWETYGEHSAVDRGEFYDEGKTVDPESFNSTFDGLGWDCPLNAIVYYSPSESDGGGATYYVDSDSKLVFQRTGFW